MSKFPLDTWNDPRNKIAFKYADNDMGYITHAHWIVSLVMDLIDIKPIELLNYSLLDYGCGTARMARLFSHYFGSVSAYDPNYDCIKVAHEEIEKTNKAELKIINENLFHTNDIDYLLDGYKNYFDFITCVNVLEHLYDNEVELEFDRMKKLLKPNGVMIFWLHTKKNKNFIDKYINKGLINIQDKIMETPYYKYKNGVGIIQIFKYTNI